MRLLISIILSTFLTGMAFCQSEPLKELTENVEDNLTYLFPLGTHNAQIIDGIKMTPRYEELNNKFVSGIQENPEWFLEQQKKMQESGEPIGYHKNLGLSKSEFNELKTYMENSTGIEMVPSDSGVIEIVSKEGIISFVGSGRLEILDYVSIDIKNKVAWVGDKELKNFSTVIVDNDNNGLKSKWKGYKWIFEETNNPEGFKGLESMDDLTNLNMKLYTLTVGRLEKNRKTYCEVKVSEIENGEKTVNIQTPIWF